ncbi:putative ribonuclease H-like domain-containing protein [Tanacetum coccineum]
MNKKYYLVVTDDYSRVTWVFFLASKDKTSGILKRFIIEIENLVDKKVKIIRCDNGTEFKNRVMSESCEEKGIKKEFSAARTPQQNGVAEKRNRTLIEAARTMLVDSKLPTTFWAVDIRVAEALGHFLLMLRMMRRNTEYIFLVFTVYEEQVHLNSVLTRLIGDLKALDSIVHMILGSGAGADTTFFQYQTPGVRI